LTFAAAMMRAMPPTALPPRLLPQASAAAAIAFAATAPFFRRFIYVLRYVCQSH